MSVTFKPNIFTRKQKKDDYDPDKTPVAEKKQSTISRLESKYSDVLGRRRRKEPNDKEDRDKTLEPDKGSGSSSSGFSNPLSRSKTAILSGGLGGSSKKERTPYRLHRQYSDRKPVSTANSYLPSARTRPELSLYGAGTNGALPKSSYYDSPATRRKELHYEAAARHKDGLYDSSARSRDPLYDPSSRYKDSLYDSTARTRDTLHDTSTRGRERDPLHDISTRTRDPLHDTSTRHKDSLYDSTNRNKDSLYDPYTSAYGSAYSNPYSSRLPAASSAASRYNDYDYLGAYGSYEGRDRDKENVYKSKYEPSRLYAELNNNDTSFARDPSKSKRAQKSYRRTATAHELRPSASYRDYLLDDDAVVPSTSSTLSASRYAPRTSVSNRKSQTQMFFDSENASALDDNNNYMYDDEVKTEAMKQREARRKEIQSLIAKYAQIDDVYNRALDIKPAADDLDDVASSVASKSLRESKPLRESKAMDYDLYGGAATAQALGLTRPAANGPSAFLPLAKTQSTSAMASLNRSRIPRTLTNFVRTLHSFCLFAFH